MEKALQVIVDIEEETVKDATVNENRLYDLSLLCVFDMNPFDEEVMINSPDTYMHELATKNLQLLLQQLQKLPSEHVEDVVVHKLPVDGPFRLPREKPVPKSKPPTKWEQFARTKGIPLRSKEKKIWDKTLKRWVPRYGAKKVMADKEKNWVREVSANEVPDADMFSKASESKRERIAKNELNRLRNIKRRTNKVPTVAVTPREMTKRDTKQLAEAAGLALRSTASLGRFNQQQQASGPHKQLAAARLTGNSRRKFAACTGNTRSEVASQLQLLDKIVQGRAVVDEDKAANRLVDQQQTEKRLEKPKKKGKLDSSKKRWIPNTKKGDKQRKAIARKYNGKKSAKNKKR